MSEAIIHPVTDDFAKNALIDKAKYEDMYKASIEDNEGFWAEHGKRIDWIKPYTKVKDVSYDAPGVSIKWFYDGGAHPQRHRDGPGNAPGDRNPCRRRRRRRQPGHRLRPRRACR